MATPVFYVKGGGNSMTEESSSSSALLYSGYMLDACIHSMIHWLELQVDVLSERLVSIMIFPHRSLCDLCL